MLGHADAMDELDTFYAHFDHLNNESATNESSTLPPEDWPLSGTKTYVRKRMNINKAAHVPGHVLNRFANQLAEVFTDIYNILLSHETLPSCLKTATIITVPKVIIITCLVIMINALWHSPPSL